LTSTEKTKLEYRVIAVNLVPEKAGRKKRTQRKGKLKGIDYGN